MVKILLRGIERKAAALKNFLAARKAKNSAIRLRNQDVEAQERGQAQTRHGRILRWWR